MGPGVWIRVSGHVLDAVVGGGYDVSYPPVLWPCVWLVRDLYAWGLVGLCGLPILDLGLSSACRLSPVHLRGP